MNRPDPPGNPRGEWDAPSDEGELEAEVMGLLHQAGLPKSYADLQRGDGDSHGETRMATDLARILRTPRHSDVVDPSRKRRRGVTGFRVGLVVVAAVAGSILLWNVVGLQDTIPPSTIETPVASPPMLALPPSPGAREDAGVDATDDLTELSAAAHSEGFARHDGTVLRLRLIHWESPEGQAIDEPRSPSLLTRYRLPDGSTTTIRSIGPPWDSEGRITPPKPDAWTAGAIARSPAPEGTMPIDELGSSPQSFTSLLLTDQRACPHTGHCLVERILALELDGTLPSNAMAVLWQALATDPSVRSVGPVVDRVGRPATALYVPGGADAENDYILYADPDTGALLGHDELSERADGIVTAFTVIVSTAHVPASAVPGSD